MRSRMAHCCVWQRTISDFALLNCKFGSTSLILAVEYSGSRKNKVPFTAENPKLSQLLNVKPTVGQNIALSSSSSSSHLSLSLCEYFVHCQDFCLSNLLPSGSFNFILPNPLQNHNNVLLKQWMTPLLVIWWRVSRWYDFCECLSVKTQLAANN